MQVTEIKSEGLSHEYKVAVAAKDIEEKISTRLKEVAKTASLPGFRPGKVPVALLKKRYGPSIMGEILEKAVGDSSREALEEKGIKPALQPQIEITSFDEGKDLEYTLSVDALPEITPMDFKSLKLERLEPTVADSEVEEALTRIAATNKSSEPVKKTRKSKNGDVIVIDFVGRIDGVEFDGGKAEDYQLELGSNSFIPGYEEQLVGKNVGDKVDVTVNFPEEYGAAELAGKEAIFEVDVKELRETTPAEINDELATTLGLENLDKLKEAIAEEQSRELRNMSRMRLKRQLLDLLADGHSFEVPGKLVEQEFGAIWGQYEGQKKAAEEAGEAAEDVDEDEQKADFQDIAERRVRLGLLLAEIGQSNNIQVAQEDINKAMMEEMKKYPGQEKMVMEYFEKNPEAQEQIVAPIYEDKVVDFVIEMAKVSDKKVAAEEMMKIITDEAAADEKPKKAKSKAKPKAKAKTASSNEDGEKKAPAKKAPAKKAAAKKADK